MSLTSYALAAAGSWLALSTAIAIPIGKAMAGADRHKTRPPSYPPPVRPSLYKIPDWMRPPVPPTDAAWLNPWPTDAESFDAFWWLDFDDAVDAVIDEMEGEFS
jgi:hypothetical protein